jgi:type IV secretory pathway TraG/TraD family ATPase VirD4
MKRVETFDGNSLQDMPVAYSADMPQFVFHGTTSNGAGAYVPFDEKLLSHNIMLLGGIGTGKTNALFQALKQLKQNLTQDDIVIVFDTKGDYYKEFYQNGDIVISNDHTATGSSGTNFWNIFNEINTGRHMMSNIIEISKILFRQKTENTNQPFFPNAAKDIFAAVLVHFIRQNKARNNKAFKDFLDSSSAKEIREMLNQYPDFKSMVSYISNDNTPQTQGVLSELQQLSREIFLENFAEEGTLSMCQMVRQKGGIMVFVEYDLSIGNMLSPIYSLLFDMAIKEALSRNKSKGNVYFVVDEFRLIPNLQHVDDAVNFGRALGIKFIIGIQNVDQVFENYGELRARSLLSGFLTSVSFRVNDEHSKDYIRGLYGKNRKMETFTSVVQSRGITEQIRDATVVEDWDISRLEVGQAIIGLPGKEPFVFKFKEVEKKSKG